MMPKKNLFKISFFLLAVVLTTSCHSNVSNNAPEFYISSPKVYSDSIPKPIGYVNDFENIFSEDEEKVLDSLIRDFETKTTIEIALITFDTTMITPDNFDSLTLQIAKQWGVGKKGKANGVLIGISRGYRQMRIQNGYGIEKILTNEETLQIINSAFVPDFREANYYKGCYNGLLALMKILGERYK